MPLSLIRDDITHVRADALVNAANEQLRRGGGVCGALFRAAGARRLQAACNKIGHCPTGSAVATPAFDLPARYVIHAVGPVWRGGGHGERELLASCYRASLELADSLGCASVAFPLISAGIYGYPHREALEVAQGEIRGFLEGHEMDVTLVLYDPGAVEVADDLRMRVERFIDEVYVERHREYRRRERWELPGSLSRAPEPLEAEPLGPALDEGSATFGQVMGSLADTMAPSAPDAAPVREGGPLHAAIPSALESMLSHLDAGFSETLLSLIDERGLKDAQVYKRANISRQHFSKMRGNPSYHPTKTTVLALAVALELTLEETRLLLERAGFALSHADRRDVIVEFFIRGGIYDVFEINDVLFAFDQPLLG